jgi:hypothetical protein
MTIFIYPRASENPITPKKRRGSNPAKEKSRSENKGVTYGVIYPAGLRHPKLVPTGTQTAFRLYETISLVGREKARSCMACVCPRE